MSEDVASIKSAIEDVKEKLDKIETKKSSIRDSVYQKVKEDYKARLEDLKRQLAGKKESLKENLKEITVKKQPLKSKLDLLQEQLEEIELRHSIGEYSDEQYGSMSGEIKDKMSEIEKDLESIKKEEEETKELLGEEVEKTEETEEKEEKEEKEEEKLKEERAEEEQAEPLPEVSQEDMIAEELFTGKEETMEESENVLSDATAAGERAEAVLEEIEQEESDSGEELFDMPEAEAGETAVEESSGASPEEDWLSSLEQELNEEAEEGKRTEEKAKKKEKAVTADKAEDKGEGELYSMCPKCNYKNRPDAWYCENCGSELTSTE